MPRYISFSGGHHNQGGHHDQGGHKARPYIGRSRASRSKEAGFTLVELMAVIILSVMSITFIYYLFIQNSRLYTTQEEIATQNSALRFASIRLEQEIQRAGFMIQLSNANNELERRCYGSWANNNTFPALAYFPPATTCSSTYMNCDINDSNQNRISPDRIEMMGNFVSNEDYAATLTGTVVQLDPSVLAGMDQTTFERFFYSPGQLLRIQSRGGIKQIVQVNTAAQSVNAAFTAGSLVISGISTAAMSASVCQMTGAIRLAPVQRVRYYINTSGANYNWPLMREVLQPTCNTSGVCTWAPMAANSPHPPLIIANNAVDLQFWFTSQGLGMLNNYDPLSANSFEIANLFNDSAHNYPTLNPRTVRSIYFRISIRSQTEDPTFAFVPRAALDQPLINFKLSSQPGAARIRQVIRHVQLVNFL